MKKEFTVTQKDTLLNYLYSIDTGYSKLNFYTQGFRKEELIIVAARPSVGKTALTLNFAHKIATNSQKPVAIFSLTSIISIRSMESTAKFKNS